MHYYLTCLDTNDSFTRNTIGNDLTVWDLKTIAQERVDDEIFWRQSLRWGIYEGYSLDGVGNETQRFEIRKE